MADRQPTDAVAGAPNLTQGLPHRTRESKDATSSPQLVTSNNTTTAPTDYDGLGSSVNSKNSLSGANDLTSALPRFHVSSGTNIHPTTTQQKIAALKQKMKESELKLAAKEQEKKDLDEEAAIEQEIENLTEVHAIQGREIANLEKEIGNNDTPGNELIEKMRKFEAESDELDTKLELLGRQLAAWREKCGLPADGAMESDDAMESDE